MYILHVDANIHERGICALLPREHWNGIAFSLDEQQRISDALSVLYIDLINELSIELGQHFGVSPDVASPFSRSGVVPLIHFFMDRFIRLTRVTGSALSAVCGVDRNLTMPNTIEQFCLMAMSSSEFNQWLLSMQAPIMGLVVSAERVSFRSEENVQAPDFINHNNLIFGNWFKRKWTAVKKRASRRLGRYPAMNLALVKHPLAEADCFGWKGFSDADDDWGLEDVDRDTATRLKIFSKVLLKCEHSFSLFFSKVEVQPEVVSKLLPVLIQYFSEIYPVQLLEGIPINLPIAIRRFKRFKGRPFFIGDINFSSNGSYFRAAAKALGSRIIGCQHGGGNYAYINDYSIGIEGEFAQCDQFITWGWRRLPDHPALEHTTTIPLPSPWLAYRSQHWIRIFGNEPWRKSETQKPHDILLVPHRIYPFPPAPSGAAISTTDHIQAYSTLLKELIKEADALGISVLHKPYNQITAELLDITMNELEDYLNHKVVTGPGKGLSEELLIQCRIVVWDQPGGGFLECLASGIPTVVLWPRHFNRESAWAIESFAALESVGLIHRTTNSLLNEVIEYKRSPDEWMREPLRTKVIAKFCRKFAWSDELWANYWKNFIRTLP